MKPTIREIFEKKIIDFQGRVRVNVSMTSYTTFRCNGLADVVYNPRNRQDLASIVKAFTRSGFVFRKDWNIIGRGSNVLIADQGYRGCLIDLSGDFENIREVSKGNESVIVNAEAGVPNGTLLQYLRNHQWSGFEFAFGIPGCIGGGIRMNAGVPQGWFSEVLEKVELMDVEGSIGEHKVDPSMFSYRDFPMAHDKIVLSGTFVFQRADTSVIQEKINVVKNQRKNQPLEFPNIGSVFKNPEGNYAGRLIEQAGLKGLIMGEAQISEKHANFIINLGHAKTNDVLSLIKKAQKEVKTQFGIHLEPEVHLLGEF
ncbi:MAG: UDP-N-acetylmuramate dehydrogenase [Bdellovibrionota bacterium]